jgi:hypothetical protein
MACTSAGANLLGQRFSGFDHEQSVLKSGETPAERETVATLSQKPRGELGRGHAIGPGD